MSTVTIFTIVALAALIHASFQVSISTFTLLSGHALGAKKSQVRLSLLITGFVFGTIATTILLLAAVGLVTSLFFVEGVPPFVWAIACGLAFGVGVATWLFYYRKEKGTVLWLPRFFADFLIERTKRTHHTGEAFSLGLTTVIAEIFFIIAPLLIAGLSIAHLNPLLQLAGIVLYVGVSSASLVVVAALVSAGHKLSNIQRWREQNKRFIQFVSGGALFTLAFYLYVNQILILATNGGATL